VMFWDPLLLVSASASSRDSAYGGANRGRHGLSLWTGRPFGSEGVVRDVEKAAENGSGDEVR
jgi:hypothetical protein